MMGCRTRRVACISAQRGDKRTVVPGRLQVSHFFGKVSLLFAARVDYDGMSSSRTHACCIGRRRPIRCHNAWLLRIYFIYLAAHKEAINKRGTALHCTDAAEASNVMLGHAPRFSSPALMKTAAHYRTIFLYFQRA